MAQPVHSPPTEDILDDPLVAVKINRVWMGHVMGLFSEAADQGYWASDQVRGEDSAIEILDLMAKGNAPVFDTLSARIRRTTTQSIPHNLFTKVTFDTAIWDVGGLFDPAFPQDLQLPVIGLWEYGCHVRWQSNAVGRRYAQVPVFGGLSQLVLQQTASAGVEYLTGSTQWRVTSPAKLQLGVIQTSGIALNIEPFFENSIDLWATYLGPL